MSSAASAPATLEEAEYNRRRLDPRPGEHLYLHLSDIRRAVQSVLPPAGARVLDFGCGGSPYRPLFKTAVYHRADLPGLPGLDYTYGEDSRVAAPAGSYDYILSTQVLEHVKNPAGYLAECRRLLAPGGSLVLTTHGLFHEHACPFDFQRWTADGLSLALTQAGFTVDKMEKLTTASRALVLFNQLFAPRMLVGGRRSLSRWLLRASRLAYTRLAQARLDRLCDEDFPDCRMVPANVPGHEFYIALLAVARPAGAPAAS